MQVQKHSTCLSYILLIEHQTSPGKYIFLLWDLITTTQWCDSSWTPPDFQLGFHPMFAGMLEKGPID